MEYIQQTTVNEEKESGKNLLRGWCNRSAT